MRNYLQLLKLSLLFCTMLALPAISMAQREVSGTVSDEKGMAMPGVTITIKGAPGGTITDLDGKYKIKANENGILVFAFVGYDTKEVPVAGKTDVSVQLVLKDNSLTEVVVVGYGTMRKGDITSSITQVKVGDLDGSPVASVDNLLQGKAAGLQVLSSTGEPGSSSSIRIRGSNSFTDNNPLYVVDGVPMGDAGNLSQINPNDIESIDVLKDASATAIYGSRGANGIIMVTTKKGKSDRNIIEVNTSYSWQTLAKPFNMITDPYLYALLSNEANTNAGTGYQPLYTGATHYGTYYPSLSEIQNGTWKYKTYWPDVIYKTAQTKNTTIAARGGNDKTLYSLSLGYYDQPGMVIDNQYNKYTINFKLDQKIKNNVSVGLNANLSFVDQNKANAAGTEGRSPVFPVYDSEGNYFKIGSTDYSNPVGVAEQILNKSRSIDIFTTGYLDWEIVKDLKFRSNVTIKYGESVSDYYEPSTYGSSGYANHGYGTINNFEATTLITDNFLTYNKTINNLHKLSIMAGTSSEVYNDRSSGLKGIQFVNDVLQNENLAGAGTQTVTNGSTSTTLQSYYTRLNYNYDQRYLFTLTTRADGSSKFGTSNKWGYFPSASLGWNVSKEAFFPKTDVLTDLKLRSSYGITGSQGISPYQTQDQLGSNIYYMNGAWATGYGPGVVYYSDSQSNKYYQGLSNSQLKWQSNAKFNIASDLSFWNDRVQVTAEYYSNKITNLLRQVDVAISSGFNKQWQNDGEVTNKGYELSVNATVLKTKDWKIDIGGNINHNQNVVVNYDYHTATENGQSYVVPSANGNIIEMYRSAANFITNGQPMNFFFGYKVAGIVQTRAEGIAAGLTGAMANPGELKYVDTNHDGKIDTYDQVNLGSPDPKFFYGFNTHVNFKNYSLNASFAGSYGNKVVNMQKMNEATSQINRWSVDNPTNEYPSLNVARQVYFSDWFIEDGSYLKIQNISLGYSVDEKYLKWIKGCRLNVGCENVWTFTKFTGYDPEVGLDGLYWGSGYPRPRTYTASINLTF